MKSKYLFYKKVILLAKKIILLSKENIFRTRLALY